jgi:hypothetical protein
VKDNDIRIHRSTTLYLHNTKCFISKKYKPKHLCDGITLMKSDGSGRYTSKVKAFSVMDGGRTKNNEPLPAEIDWNDYPAVCEYLGISSE